MERYVVLAKFTDQGIKDVKNAPKRIDGAAKLAESLGGKLVDFYLVMGEYDYVLVVDVPNTEVVTSGILTIGAIGNVRATTLRAFSEDQFTKIIKKML